MRNNKCPFCRAPLARNLLDHGLVQGLLNGLVGPADDLPEAGADGAGPSEAAAPGPLEKPIAPGDDEHFRAVVKALNREAQQEGHSLCHPPSTYVTVLFYPEGAEAQIPVDRTQLEAMGIRVVEVPSTRDAQGGALYDAQGVVDALGGLLQPASK